MYNKQILPLNSKTVHIIPIPMQYRHPSVTTCPACQQPIYRAGQHYVEARATGECYCDTACCLEAESMASDHDDYRWFGGELVPEKRILVELEVVSYG